MHVEVSETIKERLFEYLDSHRNELTTFLCKLIELKPVNPGIPGKGQELAAQEWIREQMVGIGFDKVDFWAEDSAKRRPNVVGTIRGVTGGRSLIFNGHVDVVPVYEAQLPRWSRNPWKAEVSDGKVWGRGASDMLGGIASMIFAAKAVKDIGVKLKGDLYVESVSGEESNEGGKIGTVATVQRGYRAPLAIIGEPTKGEIQTVTCGTFLFEMTVPGKEIHTAQKNVTAYPQRYGVPHGSLVGVDAIGKTIKYLTAFQEMERNWVFRWRHPILGGGGQPVPRDQEGVGVFTITPTLIEGGTYPASLAGYCKVTSQVYYPSWMRGPEVWAEVKKVIQSISLTDDWLRDHPPKLLIDKSIEGTDDYMPQWQPNEVAMDNEGVKATANAWEEATGEQTIISGFKAVCDVTYFGNEGIPAIIFGPGDFSRGVHGPDECISIDDMVKCCKTYAALALDWCGIA
jgi:acetylornithine deacetylase